MRISKSNFYLLLSSANVGCLHRDEIEDNSYPLSEYDGTGVLFHLKAESFF